jgi:hypothetical protein
MVSAIRFRLVLGELDEVVTGRLTDGLAAGDGNGEPQPTFCRIVE